MRVPGVSFSLGCDFHLSYENIDDAMQHPERYAIGNTRYQLVELSEYSAFNVAQTLYELQTVGLVPILTHPERNPLIMGKPSLLKEYAAVGCLFQITANSLTGFWGKPSQKMCEEMLRNKMVHFIASDAHSIKSRPPILSAARDAAAKNRRRRRGRKAGGRQPRGSGRQSGHRADRDALNPLRRARPARSAR